MVRDRAGAKGIRLEVMPNGNQTPTAEVDGLQIEQVLTNLLLNAIEASPEGASVCVQLADLGQVIEMKVTDQGAGIPEAVKEHVFDAFFTTRPTGTGLGLSVSREIVSAHGGTLDFTSSPEGTTFVLRLPARREP
jgi:signal transduction histidine kinase